MLWGGGQTSVCSSARRHSDILRKIKAELHKQVVCVGGLDDLHYTSCVSQDAPLAQRSGAHTCRGGCGGTLFLGS